MRKKPSEIRSLVLEALHRGDFKVGDKLPTEEELIHQYGYSRTTIREGLSSLVEEGILTRRQGSGTFVTSLSPRRNQLIAVMVPCVHDRWKSFSAGIRAIEDQANEFGYSMILCNHDGQPEKAKQYIDRLLRDGVTGVIYLPVWHGDALAGNLQILTRLEQAGVPFVLFGSPISLEAQSQYSLVASSGYQATKQMTKHLIQLGHRRLAYIQSLPGIIDGMNRYRGFQAAMAAENLPIPSEYVKEIQPVSVELQGQSEIRELLSADPAPTAVLCVHDILARNVILELQRLGKRVPEDVAVVGFDDLDFAANFHPSLTTIRPPNRDEGLRIMQLLRDKIDGVLHEERQVFLECELVIRESCGAPEEMRSAKAVETTNSLMIH